MIFNINKVIVQGITGREGSFHTKKCLEYGTNIVAGVVPGKGGQKFENKIPIYNTVDQAVKETNADTSLIFVPPKFAKDAILESAFAGIKTICCITEGIPVKDMLEVKRIIKNMNVTLIGPNCPGIMIPEVAKVGIMPAFIFKKGKIGIISRSGTLTYEVVNNLTNAGFGQSTVVGIGGDPIIGSNFVDILKKFKDDKDTFAVVLIGEIGGTMEELAAEYIKNEFNKPVVAYIAGKTAPKGKRMGHAGAIISGNKGTAESKVKALTNAGVKVVDSIYDIPKALQEVMK